MATYYVSATGNAANPGTEASPWTLTYAIAGAGGTIADGDTIIVETTGGDYTLGSGPLYEATVSTACAGSSGNVVTFTGRSPLPWLMPRIKGRLIIGAAFTTWKNLRVTWDFDTDRVSAESGSPVTDVPRSASGVEATAANVTLVNVLSHDCGGGFSAFSLSPAMEAHDCVTYNNGWNGADRGHGHGFYMQSAASPTLPAQRKTVRGLVSFANYASNGKLGGSDAVSNLIGFQYDGCTFFDPGLPVLSSHQPEPNFICDGASTRKGSITLQDCSLWMRDGAVYDYSAADAPLGLWLGDANEGSQPVTVENVRVQGRVQIGNWVGLTFIDNMVTAGDDALPWTLGRAMVRTDPTPSPYSKYTWNNNRYAHTGDARIMLSASSMQNLATWQSVTGYDAASTHTVGELTDVEFVIVPSSVDADRCTVTVWNQGGDSDVILPLGSWLGVGDSYAVYHIYDWVGTGTPTLSGTHVGGTLTVPMVSKTPPTPQGGSALPDLPNTFGVFVVRRFSSSASFEGSAMLGDLLLADIPLAEIPDASADTDPTATGVSPTRRGLFRGRTRRGR